MPANPGSNCELCNRVTNLTAHHLIPRKLHRRKHFLRHYDREQLGATVLLCTACHRGLHRLYDEMQLGKTLNTLEKLRDDPAIARHVNWVMRQRVAQHNGR